MKTSIHYLGIHAAAAVVLAGCCLAQQHDVAADLTRYIREEQRHHVRLSTGIYAYQCFTDDNYRVFRAAHTASSVAQTAKRSLRFRAIVAAIAQLPPDRRETLLKEAARIALPTWAELGRITADGSGQTEAGAAAERDISAALVSIVRDIIADIH